MRIKKTVYEDILRMKFMFDLFEERHGSEVVSEFDIGEIWGSATYNIADHIYMNHALSSLMMECGVDRWEEISAVRPDLSHTVDMFEEDSLPTVELCISAFATKRCGENIFHIEKDILNSLAETDNNLDFRLIKFPYHGFFINFPNNSVKFRFSDKDDTSEYVSGVFICYEKPFERDKGNPNYKGRIETTFVAGKIGHTSNKLQKEILIILKKRISAPLRKYESEKDLRRSLSLHHEDNFHAYSLVLNIMSYLSTINPDLTEVKKVNMISKLKNISKIRKRERLCNKKYVVIGSNFSGINQKYFKQGLIPQFCFNKQFTVRGHYRNQRYGSVGNQEYRLKWIKPYIKGKGDFSEKDYKVKE